MTLDKQPLCLFGIRSSYEDDDLFEVCEKDGSMFIIPILKNNFNFWVLLRNFQTYWILVVPSLDNQELLFYFVERTLCSQQTMHMYGLKLFILESVKKKKRSVSHNHTLVFFWSGSSGCWK